MSDGEVGGGKRVVVDGERGGEDTLAVRGDAIEASAANLGDEAVPAELAMSRDVRAHRRRRSSSLVAGRG